MIFFFTIWLWLNSSQGKLNVNRYQATNGLVKEIKDKGREALYKMNFLTVIHQSDQKV
jgi:hypothetical protein